MRWVRLMPLFVWFVAGAIGGCAWRGEPERVSLKDLPPAAAMRGAGQDTQQAPHARPHPGGHARGGRRSECRKPCYGAPACETLVRALVEQPDRAWIAAPQTACAAADRRAHAGLSRPAHEAELRRSRHCHGASLPAYPRRCSTPPRGSRAEDVTGTIGLAAEVQGELRAETELRCVAAATPPSQPERAPVAGAPQAAPAPDQLPTSSIEAPPAARTEKRPEQ